MPSRKTTFIERTRAACVVVISTSLLGCSRSDALERFCRNLVPGESVAGARLTASVGGFDIQSLPPGHGFVATTTHGLFGLAMCHVDGRAGGVRSAKFVVD